MLTSDFEFASSRSFVDQVDDVDAPERVAPVARGGGKKRVKCLTVEVPLLTVEEAQQLVLDTEFEAMEVMVTGEFEGKLTSSACKEGERTIEAPLFVEGAAAWLLQYCELNNVPCTVHQQRTQPSLRMYV